VERLSDRRIVLVVRNTRLDDLLARFSTVSHAQFYIEHLGADFSDYVREHEQYKIAIAQSQSILGRLGRLHTVNRTFLPNYLFAEDDLIVVLGQDGLVANTIKYSKDCPVVGVNPDPARWDGALLPFSLSDLDRAARGALFGDRSIKRVTMAQALLSDGQRLLGVNDLFIGMKSHVSARYLLEVQHRTEAHSSSGIIVSTGLGSTGWFRSLVTGAVATASGMLSMDIPRPERDAFPWDADYLYFTVREPFPSKTTGTSIVFGRITRDSPLSLTSQMPESGVIFSDGIESDFLNFNSGMAATITVADQQGRLVM
jgi:NAD kinase